MVSVSVLLDSGAEGSGFKSQSRRCRVIAKFQYTDTDPTRTRTDFFCGETPLGPCGSGRVRVVEFSYNSLRQTVHTHCARVHQAAKLVAALLRVAGVSAGLAESNGSLLSGL